MSVMRYPRFYLQFFEVCVRFVGVNAHDPLEFKDVKLDTEEDVAIA